MTATPGGLIHRLRVARGWSQLDLAELLCDISGQPTVTRHEVSRWERGDRLPGPFWRGWLGKLFEVDPGMFALPGEPVEPVEPLPDTIPARCPRCRGTGVIVGALLYRVVAAGRDGAVPGEWSERETSSPAA